MVTVVFKVVRIFKVLGTFLEHIEILKHASNIIVFITVLFTVTLALCYCTHIFFSCYKWWLLFVEVACLASEHRLQKMWLMSSTARTQWLWRTGLVAPQHVKSPRPGIKLVSLALASEFLSPVPSGKSCCCCFYVSFLSLLFTAFQTWFCFLKPDLVSPAESNSLSS